LQAHVVVEELSAFGHGALHLEHVLARARDAGIGVVVKAQALADARALSATLPHQLLASTGVHVFFHMPDRERPGPHQLLGSGEAEHETISENADGGIVRHSWRAMNIPLVHAQVLENFGVGDAILGASATVTGGVRRLELFRVALPATRARAAARSGRAAATVMAIAACGLVAVLVIVVGLLHPMP
jgi:hypothetical protein